jgi:hypothetical protein
MQVPDNAERTRKGRLMRVELQQEVWLVSAGATRMERAFSRTVSSDAN